MSVIKDRNGVDLTEAEAVLPTESQAGVWGPHFYRVGRPRGSSFWRHEVYDEFTMP